MSVRLFDCDSFLERESDRKGNRSWLGMHHHGYWLKLAVSHRPMLITPLLSCMGVSKPPLPHVPYVT